MVYRLLPYHLRAYQRAPLQNRNVTREDVPPEAVIMNRGGHSKGRNPPRSAPGRPPRRPSMGPSTPRNVRERPLRDPIGFSSIPLLYNHAQHTVCRSRPSFWLRSIYKDGKNAQLIAYLVTNTSFYFRTLYRTHHSYDDSFFLVRIFFSSRHQFLRNLPDEFAYRIYYFSPGKIGNFTEVECIQPHFDAKRPIHEAMVQN